MSRSRILIVAAGVSVLGVVAVVATQSDPAARPAARPTGRPSLTSNCLPVPAKIATPAWYPDDLPMPDGSFTIEVPDAAHGLRRVVFASRGDLAAFVRHALTEWKRQGWSLGRGEAEPGEAEDNFLKGNRYGVFRARTVFCDPEMTWVMVVLNDPDVKNVPTPGFNRQPSGTPSPLTS